MRRVSVVAPVFNEEAVLPEFARRVTAVMEAAGAPYELILVNDGSRDGSLARLRDIQRRDPRVRILNLSRNFGHQVAICAGLDYASGDVVAIMDSDLQDPPEVLPDFLKKQEEGYDVVYAIRRNRKEGALKKLAYLVFYRILNRIASVDIPSDSGDFCVISRRAVDTLRGMPERNRFLRGLRGWIGLPQAGLEYERDRRYAGEVKYTFTKLMKLALDGFVSFSYLPLRLASVLGLIVSALSFVGIALIFYVHFFTDKAADVPGWASVLVTVLFLGGVQLVTIGIIGEYLGRVYDEVKQRPLYVVQDAIGFDSKP
ncbi:MAG: glycosyltransferase family 2 protein [Candidatus Rokubacteria bacterium]|nr:glycosyltransferase family 2 protein [Candidatus Rokubacteria bacterium]